MKDYIKNKIRNLLMPILNEANVAIKDSISVVAQKNLQVSYKNYYNSKLNKIKFNEVGFRIYSQHEEDGLLLYIFSLIGTTNKRSVELCAGNGIECNTANLIINHRWNGLLCDGDSRNTDIAKKFYSENPDTKYWPPVIINEWLTKDNVNNILSENNYTDEIDLLSLDLDGMDYWVWKELTCITPRVVVLEINHLWGPEKSVTVPYKEDFVAEFTEYGSDYAGASLSAFVKLGKEKGYRLVGTNAIATNAFFIHNSIECEWLDEIDPADCFNHPRAQFGMSVRFPKIMKKPWMEI
jgi:hypothetical protein